MIRFLDLCTSDYFQGSRNEVFAVPVDNTTTKQQIKEALLYEYHSSCGDEIPDFEKLVNDFISECLEGPLFSQLEPFTEHSEPVYAYFDYIPK